MEKEGISKLFLEDLIANTFIELSDKNIREITLGLVENYGNVVREKLLDKYQYSILCLSRNATDIVIEKYKKYFTFKEENSNTIIILNEGITVNELIVKFRTYLPFYQLLAFMDDDVVEKGLLKPMNLSEETKGIQKKIGNR